MPGLEAEQIAEVKLGVYGLCDAPMHWRKTLVQFITEGAGLQAVELGSVHLPAARKRHTAWDDCGGDRGSPDVWR